MSKMLDKPKRAYCRLCGDTYTKFVEESYLCAKCSSHRRWARIQREIQNEREAWKNHMKIQKEGE